MSRELNRSRLVADAGATSGSERGTLPSTPQPPPRGMTETWPEVPPLPSLHIGEALPGDQRAVTCEWFRRVLEVVPTPILLGDAEGRIVFANSEMTRLFGYSAGQLDGEPIWRIVSEQHRAAHSAGLNEFFANPRAISYTRRNHALLFGQRQDGRVLSVDLEIRPVWLEGRTFAIAALTDRTECFEQELALRDGEQRLKAIVDNTSSVIYVKNLEGRYLLVNRQFERLFHVSQSQVAGKTDYDLFPPEMAEVYRRNDKQVATTGSELTIEEVVALEDGTQHTYISVKFPLRDNQGDLYAVAGISTEISDRIERLRMEQEMTSAKIVQQLLYPSERVMFPGLDLAGSAHAATQTCGDYFDFIPLSESQLVAVVGDVSGHGLGPALEMVETRAYLRAILEHADAAGGVRRLNQILCQDLPGEAFVTLFLAVVDVANRTLTYVGAGHEALLVRRSGESLRMQSTGMLLGILPDLPIHAAPVIHLQSGDVLLLTTDGVVETLSPQSDLFGWERLTELAWRHRSRPAQEIVRRIHQAAAEFAGSRARTDDSTIVAVKVL